jgi:uncharacterized cupin superfamily protein
VRFRFSRSALDDLGRPCTGRRGQLDRRGASDDRRGEPQSPKVAPPAGPKWIFAKSLLAVHRGSTDYDDRSQRHEKPSRTIVRPGRDIHFARERRRSTGRSQGQKSFDGGFKTFKAYESKDNKFLVALWESGPGVLQTDSYPNDEYVLVLEGELAITNKSGKKDEFKAGDSFVIPKGWAGTWDMKTKFKKQFVAVYEKAP